MRSSCLLSYTDHVPLEVINKELSRHESNSQQAIIMELSCEESCCSAGNNQAAEHSDQVLPLLGGDRVRDLGRGHAARSAQPDHAGSAPVRPVRAFDRGGLDVRKKKD